MLCYMGHVLTDNRQGLVINSQVMLATGTAERDVAGLMLADAASVAPGAITVGADKNYGTAGFVGSCRTNRVTQHVAQNEWASKRFGNWRVNYALAGLRGQHPSQRI